MHSQIDSVAQLVEQKTLNLWVLGSSPSGVTERNSLIWAVSFFYADRLYNPIRKKEIYFSLLNLLNDWGFMPRYAAI